MANVREYREELIKLKTKGLINSTVALELMSKNYIQQTSELHGPDHNMDFSGYDVTMRGTLFLAGAIA